MKKKKTLFAHMSVKAWGAKGLSGHVRLECNFGQLPYASGFYEIFFFFYFSFQNLNLLYISLSDSNKIHEYTCFN